MKEKDWSKICNKVLNYALSIHICSICEVDMDPYWPEEKCDEEKYDYFTNFLKPLEDFYKAFGICLSI